MNGQNDSSKAESPSGHRLVVTEADGEVGMSQEDDDGKEGSDNGAGQDQNQNQNQTGGTSQEATATHTPPPSEGEQENSQQASAASSPIATSKVNGIGMWRSWTRSFNTPVLALMDLFRWMQPCLSREPMVRSNFLPTCPYKIQMILSLLVSSTRMMTSVLALPFASMPT